MWKDFFYFTKSERRGIIVLVILIVILIIIRIVLPYVTTKDEPEECPLTKSEVEQLHQLEQQMSLLSAGEMPKGKIDPNQLDSAGFVCNGFTADQAHDLIIIKRNCAKEEFPLRFLDYAMKVNEEWIEHVK